MNGTDNEVYKAIWKYLICNILWSHEKVDLKQNGTGNFLAVQWLGLGTFTSVAQVQSLVRELRSCKP